MFTNSSGTNVAVYFLRVTGMTVVHLTVMIGFGADELNVAVLLRNQGVEDVLTL